MVNNGGPAYPESYEGDDVPYSGIGGGMTLLDRFAMSASEDDIFTHRGIQTRTVGGEEEKHLPSREESKYLYAAAMLAERERLSDG
jgi:hypothetical protein